MWLRRLARDPEDVVRAAVAGNRSASLADMERLAQDSVLSVRKVLAQNREAPAEVLDRLAVGKSCEREVASPAVGHDFHC